MENKYNDLDEVSAVFKRLFATADGESVLDILESRFDKPTLIQNANDGVAMSNLTFARIGEQNVVKYIKTLINRELTK